MNPECQAWPALQSTSRGRPPLFEVSRFEFLLSTTNAALPAAWRQWFSARRSRSVLGRWQTFRVGERRRPAERPLPARNGYRRRMEAPASRQGSLLEVSVTGAGRCRSGWPGPRPSSRPQPPAARARRWGIGRSQGSPAARPARRMDSRPCFATSADCLRWRDGIY